MKVCKKCNVEKELTEFTKDSKSKDKLRNNCRECRKKDSLIYYHENKQWLKIKSKEWEEKNKDVLKQKKKIYRENNKEYAKKYRLNNKDKAKEYAKEYYKNNKDRKKIHDEKYRLNNKHKKNEYSKKRKLIDPLYKLRCDTRNLIGCSIRRNGYTKKSRTFEILGCSFEEFKIHLENKFVEGMSWDNRSKWHIDHIIPVSSAKTEEEIIKLNYYTNLQPLWAKDNLKKSNKI